MGYSLKPKKKQKPIDEETKIEDLRIVKEVLDKHKIKYWLDCGALLGAMRNKKLIHWDHDIDLGAWFDSFEDLTIAFKDIDRTKYRVKINEKFRSITIFNRGITDKFYISLQLYEKKDGKAIKKWLIHPGQMTYHENTVKKSDSGKSRLGYVCKYLLWVFSSPRHMNERPWFLPKIAHRGLIRLAFMLPRAARKRIYNFVEKIAFKLGCRYIKIKIPIKYFKNLKTISFYGMGILIPAKAEKYLEFRYGEDWRTPKEKWIFYKDYACLSK